MLHDYATDNIISDILRIAPVQFAGAFSVPRRFPWPLNRLPLFSFGQSMNARQELVGIMRGVLDERRNEVKSTTPSGGSKKHWRNAGVLGAFLDIQAKQVDAGGPGEGEVEINDDYIITSVSNDCDCIVRYSAAFRGGSLSPSILVLPSDSIKKYIDACALVIQKCKYPHPGDITAGVRYVSCGMENQLVGYIAHGAASWVC